MLRKAGIATALLLALPAFANAWTLTAKISSGQGTITAAKNVGTVGYSTYSTNQSYYSITKTGAGVVGYFRSTNPTQTVNVAPINGGVLNSVYLDGVKVANAASYTVDGTDKKNHTLVVYYSSSSASVAVNQAAGGAVYIQHLDSKNNPVGAYSRTGFSNLIPTGKIKVFAAPNSDYKVTSINGTPVTGDVGEVVSALADVSVGTVTATFALVPSIQANLIPLDSTGRINYSYLSGATVTMSATARSNDTLSYSWAVNGATVAGATGATYTFAPTSNCTVDVTVTPSTDSSKAVTKTVNLTVQSTSAAASNVCTSCHSNRNPVPVALAQSSAHSANATCADCHGATHAAKTRETICASCHSEQSTGFFASPHWNNSSYEAEPEAWSRTGEDAALPAGYISQVSDIKVALEDQNIGNCMNRCHFRPGQGGVSIADNFGPAGVGTTIANNGLPGTTPILKGVAPVGKWACAACHSTGGAAGDGTKGALASGNLQLKKGGPGLYGTMPDGTVIVASVPGVVMANVSTSGTEHTIRSVNMYQTCLMCHFGKNHGNPTYSYLKSDHYANPYYMYGDKQVQCQDCHNPHSTETAFPQYDATTYAQTATGACDKCHTAENGYGIFNADKSMKKPHNVGGKLGNGGAALTLSNYAGWYSASRTVFANATSQYVTPNNSCNACHGHNNAINPEYAETMHSDPYGRTKSATGFKFKGYSSAVADQYTPATVGVNDGCVRCHTTTGFVNFIESDYKDLRAWGFKNTADTTGEVINCRACHRVTKYEEDHPEKAAPDAFTQPGMGNPLPEGTYNWVNDYTFTLATKEGVRNPIAIRGWGQPYTGYYNYSVAKVKKFVTAVPFKDYKMSNVCVSCHAGRNGATNGDALQTLGGFANFTTLAILGNKAPGLPHGVYQSAILNGSIGYQFSSYTTNRHKYIGTFTEMATTNTVNTPGPCVACHMDYKTVTGKPDGVNSVTTQHRKHNFEIKGTSVYTALCSKCHAGMDDAALDASKARFKAGVLALAEIMKTSNNKYGKPIVTGAELTQYGTTSYKWSLSDSKRGIPGVSFAGNSQGYAKLIGSYYNLQLLWNVAFNSSDLGAYAHNPGYLKHLLQDTINELRAAETTSVVDAINQLPTNDPAVGLYFPGYSAVTQVDALTYLQ